MVKGRQMFKTTGGLRQPGAFIPQLESFRGWAILLVVAFHVHGILLGEGPLSAASSIWLAVGLGQITPERSEAGLCFSSRTAVGVVIERQRFTVDAFRAG